MASPAKLSKRTTVAGGSNSEGWGMGFLLVFFPQQQQHGVTFKPPAVNALLKRSNSVNLLSKAQSTISVCAVVIFFTLLLFTLSNFEPNNNITSGHYRRHLSQSGNTFRTQNSPPALQRLGTLYSRGTKSMNEIVICHVPESTTSPELKSFLRAFHRSGLPAKSDLLFIFPSITTPEVSDNVIREENRLFLKLIRNYKSELGHRSNVSDFHFPASFDMTQFVKSGKSEKSEPIWGRKIKYSVNNSNSSWNSNSTESTRLSCGSVVGFGVGELDPENALSGFVDHVLISQRRWAAYPMLLGRLRRNYKHVTLVDVKDVLIMGDPLAGLRNSRPETVFLLSKHNRKPTDKAAINPSLITGGARGVRRLSAAMLTEIVRSTSHKKKIPATESALLSRLVTNEVVQKNIHMVVSGELIPEASSLSGVVIANKGVVRRGNSNNMDIELTKRICSFAIEASVYTDCRKYNFSSV